MMEKVEIKKFKTLDELRAWLTLCITDALPMTLRKLRELKPEDVEEKERIIQITASAYLTILEMITEEGELHNA